MDDLFADRCGGGAGAGSAAAAEIRDDTYGGPGRQPRTTVTVVVPTKNAARTLRACLESIVRQSVRCGLVVVDCGSVDDSKAIASGFADLVLNVAPDPSLPRPVSLQRNGGARALPADVVGFVDADMVVGEHVVEQAIEQIAAGAGSVIVPERSFGENYWAKVRAFERSMYLGTLEYPRFFSYDLFEAIGGWDEDLPSMEDTDLWLRASTRARVGRTSDVILHDEGALTYLDACRKKAGYATGVAAFRRKHGSGALAAHLRRPYFEHPSSLFAQPTLGMGVLALKSGEAAAIASRLLLDKASRPEHRATANPTSRDDVTPPAARRGEHGDGTPLVSVVLATFNRAYLLEDTLKMVLAQTLDDFELIVCDDGSTDETPIMMAEWAVRDPRIQYVRQPRNLGLAGNVRRGIDLAKAELVAVLYDGDVYDPRLLERWVAALNVCPGAAFVFNAYNQLDANGTIEVTYREHLDSCVPGRVLLERLYFRRWHFSSPVWGTVMLRKSKYLAAGGLDIGFSFVADVDLYLRLAETNCVAYVPEPLIGLASRETVPKFFRHPQRLVRRAFREARVRHYRDRPLRLWAEMFRHWTFATMDVAVGPMLGPADRLRRRFIRRRPQEGGHVCG